MVKLLLYTLIISFAIGSVAVMYAQSDSNEQTNYFNIVLLMDHSGSLNSVDGKSGNDPDKLRCDAAVKFIELLSLGGDECNRVACFSFDKDVECCEFSGKLESVEQKDILNKFLLDTDNLGNSTNIYGAMTAAVEWLDNINRTSPLTSYIILFTDGINNINTNESDHNATCERIKAGGYNVFTVQLGLDSISDIISDYKDYSSEGEIFMANTAEDLEEFYDKMRELIFGTQPTEIVDTVIDEDLIIPNLGIKELCVMVESEKPVNFTLTDPSGGNIENIESYCRRPNAQQPNWAFYTIVDPAVGKWHVHCETADNQALIKCEIYKNLNFTVSASANPASNILAGGSVEISAEIEVGQTPIVEQKDETYDMFAANALLYDSNNNELKNVSMTYDRESFKGNMQLNDAGSYKVKVVLSNSNLTKESSMINLSAVEQPELDAEVFFSGDIRTNGVITARVTLIPQEYSENYTVSFELKSNSGLPSPYKDQVMNYDPVEKTFNYNMTVSDEGIHDFYVTVTDKNGVVKLSNLHLGVMVLQDREPEKADIDLLPYISAVAGAALLVVIIILIKKNPGRPLRATLDPHLLK